MMETNRQITTCFAEQLEQNKDRTAVKSINRELSYDSLNRCANTLAGVIRDKRQSLAGTVGNSQTNERAALLFGQDVDMIIGILGILKAGCAYVALDPHYPVERSVYILQDSEIRLLVTDNENLMYAQKLIGQNDAAIEIINLDNIGHNDRGTKIDININPEQYAYIMYTSGSTGKPKGVIQSHRNIVHFIGAYAKSLGISPADKILLLTSYSHTVSAIDIFSALLNGASIYIYDITSEADIAKLAKWMKTEGITVYHSVPTIYRYLLGAGVEKDDLSEVRLVILGGEEVFKRDVELYRHYFTNECRFVNLFGSSELLIASSFIIDKSTEITKDIVPIGLPLDGVEILLLNEENEKVGVFGVGELVYKSDYLSPGYWHTGDKETGVFVKNPLDGRGIVYRSGDLGRRMIDGNIEYLGRKDFQIKIRGNRVELGEIESIIDNLDDIGKSVVTAFKKESGENELAAYYTTKSGGKIETDIFMKALAQKIPDYMIPSRYLFLERLPLTPNGKIDRKNLPEPVGTEEAAIQYVPPRNEIDEKMIVLWQEILEKEKIGINENFFRLGGHSLLAITLINKIYQTFDVEISLGDLMDNQTIAKLADYIQDIKRQDEKIEEILSEIEAGNTAADNK